MYARLLAVLLLCAFTVSKGEVKFDELENIEGSTYVYTVDALGLNVQMDCRNVSRDNYPNFTLSSNPWMLPSLDLLQIGHNDGRREVSDEGYGLLVRNVSRYDFGQYHCLLRTPVDNAYFLVKFGINLRGPFFKDGWDEYRMNTIVGLSAFFGFLVLYGLVWFVYTYRWQAKEVDATENTDSQVLDAYSDFSKTERQFPGAPEGSEKSDDVSPAETNAVQNQSTSYDNNAYEVLEEEIKYNHLAEETCHL